MAPCFLSGNLDSQRWCPQVSPWALPSYVNLLESIYIPQWEHHSQTCFKERLQGLQPDSCLDNLIMCYNMLYIMKYEIFMNIWNRNYVIICYNMLYKLYNLTLFDIFHKYSHEVLKIWSAFSLIYSWWITIHSFEIHQHFFCPYGGLPKIGIHDDFLHVRNKKKVIIHLMFGFSMK